jgi:hypothetical protein
MAANGELHDWLVVVEIETGMEENNSNDFNIFPNPSNGSFYLESSGLINSETEIQLMDLTGRIVYEKHLVITEKFEIDLSGNQKGMYFLRVKAREMVMNRKVIIQ